MGVENATRPACFLAIRLDRFPSVIGTFFDAEVPDGLV